MTIVQFIKRQIFMYQLNRDHPLPRRYEYREDYPVWDIRRLFKPSEYDNDD